MKTLVSGGIGSPLLGLASGGEQTQYPQAYYMQEWFPKVYDGDGSYYNETLLPEASVLQGYRYNVTIDWGVLTRLQVQALFELFAHKEAIRFTPHQENPDVYFDCYLRSALEPKWLGDTYIPDLLSLKITLESIDLITALS